MPQHVIVDGSNLATEGRTLPSLKQLNEAISAYREDHPDALITVVVDATFGHRIDAKEVAAFEKAIETNAFVAPPAGAVGRGDGFILSIAQKVHASILSNDSYQEFHGEYDWLFDEGRLIGGKPVPYVGWVFVNRVPVRGPISRRSVKEQKVVDKSPSRGRSRKAAADAVSSISADGPMPVPKSPPPGAVMPGQRQPRDTKPAPPSKAAPETKSASRSSNASRTGNNDGRQPASAPKSANDLLAFLSFVEHYPVGTAVTAVVETYSSHGAYVAIGDAKGYVPLRLMADPAPRSAREVMAIGETVTLVVSSFGPARRSIDLAVPAMAPPAPPVAPPKVRKTAAKKAAVSAARLLDSAEVVIEALAIEAVQIAAAVEPPSGATGRGRKATAKKAADPSKATTPRIAAEPKKAAAPRKPVKATKPEPAPTFDSVFEDQAAGEPAALVPAKRSGQTRRGGTTITKPAESAIDAPDPPSKRTRTRAADPAVAPKPRAAKQASAADAAPSAVGAKPSKRAGGRRPVTTGGGG